MVYWGYNPLSNLLPISWDIQVSRVACGSPGLPGGCPAPRHVMWDSDVDFDLAAFHSLVRALKRSLVEVMGPDAATGMPPFYQEIYSRPLALCFKGLLLLVLL